MKKRLITCLILIVCSSVCQAQILMNGTIKFERKSNLKLQAKNTMSDNNFGSEYINELPTAVSSYFELSFTPEKSIYKFVSHQEVTGIAKYFVNDGPARENTVYRDLVSDSIAASKKFYDANFFIKDLASKSDWKFNDEIRVIAGYTCRKAVTTLYDSLVVVAFYTDEILATSGPESFSGLPGMILGVAVPKLYTTWFATEVTTSIPAPDVFKYNFKGKAISLADANAQVLKATKDWGSWSVYGQWWIKI